jgi:hypothetical protein
MGGADTRRSATLHTVTCAMLFKAFIACGAAAFVIGLVLDDVPSMGLGVLLVLVGALGTWNDGQRP